MWQNAVVTRTSNAGVIEIATGATRFGTLVSSHFIYPRLMDTILKSREICAKSQYSKSTFEDGEASKSVEKRMR